MVYLAHADPTSAISIRVYLDIIWISDIILLRDDVLDIIVSRAYT